MAQSELIKRALDLMARCERTSSVTCSGFLTPAEIYEISNCSALTQSADAQLYLTGGRDDCERQVMFFLPFYIQIEDFDPGEYITAVMAKSFFGEPGHRDYLGAVLGLGISRDRVGDIILNGDTAYIFCSVSVADAILNDLEKVGRYTVRLSRIPLSDVPSPERSTKRRSFTVKSLRLDAVAGDMFGISRTAAAELIRLGAVSLNYSVCQKTDAEIKEGDIISLRGHGKGCITEVGGRSKKDRLFVEADIFT